MEERQRALPQNRADTIDDSHMRGPARLKLKIQPPPPEFPYADTFFEVEVFVVDQNEQLKRGEDVPLSLQLVHYETKMPVRDGVLVVDRSSQCRIARSGAGKLRIRVADDSTVERRRFQLRVEPIGREDIEGAVSEKMTVVRNRLEIDENPQNPIPTQWFKDEGGRENCIELRVQLRDANNRNVRNRPVPLKLVLMYESLQRVHNQDILKLSPDSRLAIDEHGRASLRVRIEEVSKNHQKQAFRVKVEPDVQEQPLSVDISSAVSKPIQVLSKRIPKRKDKDASNASIASARRPAPKGRHASSASSAGSAPAAQNSAALSPSAAYGGPPAAVAAAAAAGGGGGAGGGVDVVDFAALNNSQMPFDVNSVTLYDALKSVIQWTGKVVNGLQTVQWQLLGYERKPDGSPNHDRPLYNVQNPNPTINAIIRQYATDTMHNLHVLLKRIEAGSYEDGPVAANPVASSNAAAATAALANGVRSRNAGDNSSVAWAARDEYGTAEQQQQQQPPPSKRQRRDSGAMNGGGGGGGVVTRGGGGGGMGGIGNGMQQQQQLQEQQQQQQLQLQQQQQQQQQGMVAREEDDEQHAPPLALGGSMLSVGFPAGAGPPALLEQPSFAMFQPNFLQHGNSMMLEGLQTNGEGGEILGEQQSPQMDASEANVHYILAKGYLSRELGMLGFPAYDYARYLLGFYKENQAGAGGETQIVFNPLHRIQGLDERDMAASRSILDAEMKKGSQSVFSLPNCGNSLYRMREDAFMYYFSKSMIFNLDGQESTVQQQQQQQQQHQHHQPIGNGGVHVNGIGGPGAQV